LNLGLEGSDGISIFFPHIFFDVLAKNYDGVVVLLHTALGALDTRLEPLDDAFVVEDVLALELLVGPLGHLKTDCTSV
jgi:hypothetical protein